MDYYFPGIISSLYFPEDPGDGPDFMVDSGKNALRLLLRNCDLPGGSKVALPAFVCDAVRQAVTLENLSPVFLDLKGDSTFWTDYNPRILRQEGVRAIVLVHLYGFLHPDTQIVSEFCRDNKIKLIHDAAPSFGVDESLLTQADGIVYSFGVGKSSTACGGGWLRGIGRDFYNRHVRAAPPLLFRQVKSRLQLKSRIFGYRFSPWERALNSFVNRLNPADKRIFALGGFEKKAARYAMKLVKELGNERKLRHRCLADEIKGHPSLSVAYDDNKGAYFKFVLLVKEEKISDFKTYLKQNNVPYFCLYDSINSEVVSDRRLFVFQQNAPRFIEISCEASIPLDEIKRVAGILKAYQ